MGYRDEIREMALGRRIPHLTHFTPSENIPGIVARDLLSRMEHHEREPWAIPTDGFRRDGREGAVSVSVSAVNCDLLQTRHSKRPGTAWVILFLDPSILWTHPCRLNDRNAAGIPDFLTARANAEVQVFDSISPEAIVGAWVDDPRLSEMVDREMARLPGPDREIVVRKFAPRFSNGFAAWG